MSVQEKDTCNHMSSAFGVARPYVHGNAITICSCSPAHEDLPATRHPAECYELLFQKQVPGAPVHPVNLFSSTIYSTEPNLPAAPQCLGGPGEFV